MNGLKTVQSRVAVLNRANVDTDQIIPKQFLKKIDRIGFGDYLFYHWRYDDSGHEREDFELNQIDAKGCSILIAGENFGCGSSREHAPWALLDYGFRVVIATSFADIFYQNCLKNGMLPIKLPKESIQYLIDNVSSFQRELRVDLPNQVVKDSSGFEARFDIHPYWKEMLVNGWDEISLTLQLEDKINEYEFMYR
ncbi:3-isopropylmalate dehydratase small subunit [Peribacillus alkalitolerans]|uniref:3-isopropylmalate dehydratase small subunit n=1 Tax=Peribacillus alkalitolerans TaxID=1550385 RepID=UPI0013D3E4AD|nr:3-isopropylmalate dehydratase small subunit [Peribacillus alkalitolerans]